MSATYKDSHLSILNQPPLHLQITRVAQYAHNSLLARRWRGGRVLLAGDAAHMMPPSAGQGMCAGVRDAVNLAWKLHLVTTGRAAPPLLDTYERERRAHVHDTLKGTLFIGDRLQAKGALQRWRRRNELKLTARCWRCRPWSGSSASTGLRCGRGSSMGSRAGGATTCDRSWCSTPGGSSGPTRWMRERELDFVLARPDKQIFGAGAAKELPRVQAALAAGLGVEPPER